jgi:glucosamine--fructose-6-phosphate aminotransferase (isomerizing)
LRPSQLAREAGEAAAGARLQIATCASRLDELARRLRARPPALVVTCARGSSDHAATYGKYLIETTVGRVVASVGPSVASRYHRTLAGLDQSLFVAVSQSGRSPDLIELATSARAGGALVVGMINDEASPLAALCDIVLPLCGGPERGVAATKSFLLSGLAFLQLAAAWTGDAALLDAVARAPDALAAACEVAWPLASLATATSLYVLGRGVGLGAACELALKLKETCALHAEAFSTAEVLHGPVALVTAGFPILALGQDDETAQGTRDVVAQLVGLGAVVRTTLDVAGAERLPTIDAPAVLAPLCQVQSCYLALAELAAARGLDVDAPAHLTKITETV